MISLAEFFTTLLVVAGALSALYLIFLVVITHMEEQ